MTVQSRPVQQLTPFGHALAGKPLVEFPSSFTFTVVQVPLAVYFLMRELHFSDNGQHIDNSTE